MKNLLVKKILDNYLLKKKAQLYFTSKIAYFSFFRSGNIGIFDGYYYTLSNIKRYFFLGLVTGIFKKGTKSSIVLRNVLGNCLIEVKYLIFNPLIYNFRVSKLTRVFKKKSKLYFVLNLPFLFRVNKYLLKEFLYYKKV